MATCRVTVNVGTNGRTEGKLKNREPVNTVLLDEVKLMAAPLQILRVLTRYVYISHFHIN